MAPETYTHGHHPSVLRSHTWRTIANSAAYLEPHLSEGQRILDVGCGPGTITAEFAERDMFKTDISKASVLTLYVLPEFMQKLRAKVQSELKPGTRVVAHDYHMGDWYPDRSVTLTVPEKIEANGTDKAYIYLWIVPTKVQGSWNLDFEPAGKVDPLIVAFNQNYQMISAATVGPGQPTIADAKLKGDEVSFNLTMRSIQYQFTGKVDGNKIEGKALAAGSKDAISWRATKAP
jgi:hypothetical protein